MDKCRITYTGDGWYWLQMLASPMPGAPWVDQDIPHKQIDQLTEQEQKLVSSYRDAAGHGLEGYWVEY